MATKVKPTRLQITGTPQVGQVPTYVDKNTFAWGAGGGVKVIEIRGPGDYASADEARAEYLLGNPVIVMYGGMAFQFTTDTVLYSDIPSVFSTSTISAWMLTLTLSSDAVTGITQQNMTFTKPGVIDDLTSSSTTDALSANQGKVLKTLIDNLTSRGRFLSLWNSATGLAVSTPQSLPYTYQTGDYFIVGVVSSADPAVNYRPDGNSYTGTASTVLETEEVEVGDTYAYDGTNRLLQNNHGKTVVLTAGNGIDINNNVISTASIYGESTTAAATVQKEVTIPSIKTLEVGQVIVVKPTVTSTVANSTLKLNNFDAYGMLYNGAAITTSTDSIVWAANVPSMFYLDEVSGTKYWRFLGHGLDSNTTYTLNRLIDPSRYHVGTGTYAFSRYSLVMEKADGTWEKITNTAASYSTGTTKTVNTNGFRLGHIRYYNTTTNLANGALVATSALDIQAPSVNAAYSFNCGSAPGWAVGTPIYLVGSMGADGLFYLDTTQRWSTQLPSTNDGKLYIRLGTALSADNANFSLIEEKPIFYYDNGIKIYQQADNKQDVISDLAAIRSGATCGSTSVQPGDLACYAQCCDIPDTSCFQLTCNLVCDLSGADNTHYPSAKAVADAIQGAGGGDMMKSVYDPCGCNDDAFDYCNFHNTPTIPDVSNLAQCCDIPTNNNQLANGCGYTTCTGTLSTCSDITTALGFTPYSAANPCGYTTCTGTLQACDIANLAQCCDIPTNNNQLANGCGYITGISCLDVTSALGYTPYNAGNPCNYINNFAGVVSALGYTPYNTTNPCGFTTCTGTVVDSDLTPYAKSCDLCAVATSGKYCDLTGQPTIPTDNCQLANGCGYTTCTGTLVPSDISGLVQESCIACVNGCCLTQGGNICIQGGSGIQNDTTGTTDVIDAIWSGTQVEFNNITHDPDVYYIVKDGQGGGSSIMADILVVGAGGGGSGVCNACKAGYGGGGGEVIECKREILNASSYNISIGQGGTGSCICTTDGGDGGDTTISAGGNIVYCARGGHGAIRAEAAYGNSVIAYMKGFERCFPGQNWKYGASGNLMYGGTLGCSTAQTRGGGGGGAGGYGEAYLSSTGVLLVGGTGGPGVLSDLSGDRKGYGGGGGGGSGCCPGFGGYGGGGIGNGNATLRNGEANTGGGGGGGGYCECGGDGGSGVAIIRYLQDGSCGINCATGGTVYCCNGYVIHCFTSDGTFCIVC